MVCRTYVLWFLMCFFQVVNGISSQKSPYFQHLPDCHSKSYQIKKKTSLKGIVCPVVKDEEGFLSEWTAYYEMHGIDQIIFYDHNSSSSFAEIQPWIDSGFATIKRNWWINNVRINVSIPDQSRFTSDIKQLDYLNEIAGIDCKLNALDMGIDLYFAFDLDEYAVPNNPALTLMDDVAFWMETTGKKAIFVNKLNYSPTPHIHEPIHLLTIEAYQSRYSLPSKMSYYATTAAKAGYLLRHPSYFGNITNLLMYCCSFHGCSLDRRDVFTVNGAQCEYYAEDYQVIWNKKGQWISPPALNHYARSLEKFAVKQESWDNLGVGNDSAGNPQGLSIYNFMNRAYGSLFDDRAVKYGCQVRQLLATRTGIPNYLRPGDSWYRNAEYGKPVNNPLKRGRKGKGEGIKVLPIEYNEYPPGDTYQAARPQTNSATGGTEVQPKKRSAEVLQNKRSTETPPNKRTKKRKPPPMSSVNPRSTSRMNLRGRVGG